MLMLISRSKGEMKMTNIHYNEFLDSNYLSADIFTEDEMKMLEKYYRDENILKEDEELPF